MNQNAVLLATAKNLPRIGIKIQGPAGKSYDFYLTNDSQQGLTYIFSLPGSRQEKNLYPDP